MKHEHPHTEKGQLESTRRLRHGQKEGFLWVEGPEAHGDGLYRVRQQDVSLGAARPFY